MVSDQLVRDSFFEDPYADVMNNMSCLVDQLGGKAKEMVMSQQIDTAGSMFTTMNLTIHFDADKLNNFKDMIRVKRFTQRAEIRMDDTRDGYIAFLEILITNGLRKELAEHADSVANKAIKKMLTEDEV